MAHAALFPVDGVVKWCTYFQVKVEGGGICGSPPVPDERWAGEGAGGGCVDKFGAVASNS